MAMEEKSRRALGAVHGSRHTHAALSHQLSQKEGSSEHKFIAGTPCISSIVFSSVQCPTRCDPMDCNTPGFPVFPELAQTHVHHLPELAQTHVHRVNDAIQPSSSVISFSSCLQSVPASGSFPVSQLFASGGQSIGVSASTSVFPMNTQD